MSKIWLSYLHQFINSNTRALHRTHFSNCCHHTNTIFSFTHQKLCTGLLQRVSLVLKNAFLFLTWIIY